MTPRSSAVEAGLEAGRHRDLLAEPQRLVRAAPLRERRWELLALAEYRAGRQGDALRTIRQVKQLLLDELGLDPGPGPAGARAVDPAAGRPLLPPSPEPPFSAECPYPGSSRTTWTTRTASSAATDDITACLRRLRPRCARRRGAFRFRQVLADPRRHRRDPAPRGRPAWSS